MFSQFPLTTPCNLCIEIMGPITPAARLTLAAIKVTMVSILRLLSAAKGHMLSNRTTPSDVHMTA